MAKNKVLICCRYGNEPHAELQVAAAEQMAITELRLRKLLEVRQQGQGAGAPSTGDPLASAARRAGRMRAHLGAMHRIALVPAVVHAASYFCCVKASGCTCPTSQSCECGNTSAFGRQHVYLLGEGCSVLEGEVLLGLTAA